MNQAQWQSVLIAVGVFIFVPLHGARAKTLSLETITGSIFEVPDFRQDPDVTPALLARGAYYLGYAPYHRFGQNQRYRILYHEAQGTQGFSIWISRPLQKNRLDAEKYLMNKLKLSKGQMCFLRYSVMTDISSSRAYAVKDLKFSFCPGAVRIK